VSARQILWMRSADVYPDGSFPPTDFVAFDGEEIIGRVYQIRHGIQEGLWFWTMTVSRPGPTFNARSGTEARRGDSGRRVVEPYEAMLRRTRGWKPAPEDYDNA
jgi:hypothetical protein